MSLLDHYENFTKGVINTRDLVYSGVLSFSSSSSPRGSWNPGAGELNVNWRDQFKKRKVIYGAGSVVSVLLVVGILIVMALLANWHQFRWDATQGQTQSLSAVTKTLLKQVDKPLTMTVFIPEGSGERGSVKDMLQSTPTSTPR